MGAEEKVNTAAVLRDTVVIHCNHCWDKEPPTFLHCGCRILQLWSPLSSTEGGRSCSRCLTAWPISPSHLQSPLNPEGSPGQS